ncbi:MAG: metallophosphoesterase [Desulfobacterales bacterium]
MKVLFVTDLHGCAWKYDRLCQIACTCHPDAVVNSGDLLPKNCNLFEQHFFIRQKLCHHFAKFEQMGIPYLCYLGNDDLKIWDGLFDEICGRYQYVHNIAQRKISIQDFEFVGMNWVTDYPFRLKDRCRMDAKDWQFGRQFGTALLSTPEGWKEIDNWQLYANTLPSIAEEMEALAEPEAMDRSVYILHMPPNQLGLDVCMNGQEVGSKAIHDFIAARQPRLTLHGHIHESPDISGAWKAELGNTACVQPGQLEEDELTFVIAELDAMEIQRYVEAY